MKKQGAFFETLLGGAVLVVAVGFVFYGARTITPEDDGTRRINHEARFLQAGGLRKGADVVMNGVPIGTVTSVFLDKNSLEAVVHFERDASLPVPSDSFAAIGSDGLTGGKYLILYAGKSKNVLKEGASLDKTMDYESLEDKVSRIIFLATGENDG